MSSIDKAIAIASISYVKDLTAQKESTDMENVSIGFARTHEFALFQLLQYELMDEDHIEQARSLYNYYKKIVHYHTFKNESEQAGMETNQHLEQ